MTEKKSTITYADLPDAITPLDYADWMGIGENKAREIFNSPDFPRIKGTGAKQVVDKRAALLYNLRLTDEDKNKLLEAIATVLTQGLIKENI